MKQYDDNSSEKKPSLFKELKRQVVLTADTISKELKKSDDFAFRWVLWVGVVLFAVSTTVNLSSAAIERLTDTYTCTPEQKVVVNESVKSCMQSYADVELNRENQITLREKNFLDQEVAKRQMDYDAMEKGLIEKGTSLKTLRAESFELIKLADGSVAKSCTKSALKVNCKLSILGNEQ